MTEQEYETEKNAILKNMIELLDHAKTSLSGIDAFGRRYFNILEQKENPLSIAMDLIKFKMLMKDIKPVTMDFILLREMFTFFESTIKQYEKALLDFDATFTKEHVEDLLKK